MKHNLVVAKCNLYKYEQKWIDLRNNDKEKETYKN